MEEDRHYYLLFERHPVPMWVYDRETHRFLKANEAALLEYGYTKPQLLKMTIEDIRVPAEGELSAGVLDLPDEISFRELGLWKHRTRDGRVLDVNVLAVGTVYDGRPAGFLIAQDVTERLRAERQRNASESYFRYIADHAPVMMWMSGVIGIEWKNRPWLEFTGRTLEQEMGAGWMETIHPDDLPRLLPLYEEAFVHRRPIQTVFRLRRRDGMYRWVLDTATPRFSADGAYAGHIGSAIDITDRKRAEEQREVALRENARLLRAAEESAERQQRFLRDVLHSVTEGKLHLCTRREELPAPLACPINPSPLPLTADSLGELRRRVRAAAECVGMSEERRHNMTFAVGEAAMNAVVHAGGGTARVYCGESPNGRVQVWIEDSGKGIDLEHLPRATLERGYSSRGSLGHGFWIMLRSCDRIWLLTGSSGTTVVLEQEQTAPPDAAFF